VPQNRLVPTRGHSALPLMYSAGRPSCPAISVKLASPHRSGFDGRGLSKCPSEYGRDSYQSPTFVPPRRAPAKKFPSRPLRTILHQPNCQDLGPRPASITPHPDPRPRCLPARALKRSYRIMARAQLAQHLSAPHLPRPPFHPARPALLRNHIASRWPSPPAQTSIPIGPAPRHATVPQTSPRLDARFLPPSASLTPEAPSWHASVLTSDRIGACFASPAPRNPVCTPHRRRYVRAVSQSIPDLGTEEHTVPPPVGGPNSCATTRMPSGKTSLTPHPLPQ